MKRKLNYNCILALAFTSLFYITGCEFEGNKEYTLRMTVQVNNYTSQSIQWWTYDNRTVANLDANSSSARLDYEYISNEVTGITNTLFIKLEGSNNEYDASLVFSEPFSTDLKNVEKDAEVIFTWNGSTLVKNN